jgi:hypothetical protein
MCLFLWVVSKGQYMYVNSRFEKSGNCPTNEALLAFLQTKSDFTENEDLQPIVEHLAVCEFCELMLELLRDYPAFPAVVPPPVPPVPDLLLHLFTTQPVNN